MNNPKYSSNAIVVEEPEGGGLLVITIFISGVTSYFTFQKPTRSEYEYGDLKIIDFFVEDPD